MSDAADFSIAGPAVDTLGDPYALPFTAGDRAPATYLTRLLALDEFEHLKSGEADIAVLMRAEPKVKQGRRVLGTVYLPAVQGELSPVFDWLLGRFLGRYPDYLMVLEDGWWEAASPRQREILIYHELCHCVQKVDQYGEPRFDRETGKPIWGLQAHDVEEFNAVVSRYGAWTPEIVAFVAAAQEGFKL